MKPYPNVLTIQIVDEISDGISGLTESDGAHITIRYELESFPRYVVHETVHAVQFVEDYIGHKLDLESQAYLTLYIVDATMLKFLKYIDKLYGKPDKT